MTKTFHALFLAAFAAFSFCAHAAEANPPPDIAAIVETVLPAGSFTLGEHAIGDINRDELPDLAVLVVIATPEGDQEQEQKILLFLAGRNGSYTHFATSGDVLPQERVEASLKIEKQLLVLHREIFGGCCSTSFSKFKFKMLKGELTLIGVDVAAYSTGDDVDDSGTSSNFLARKTISWRKIGNKRKEIATTLPPFELIKFASFSYLGHDQFLPAQTRGYLDDHFKLRQ